MRKLSENNRYKDESAEELQKREERRGVKRRGEERKG